MIPLFPSNRTANTTAMNPDLSRKERQVRKGNNNSYIFAIFAPFARNQLPIIPGE